MRSGRTAFETRPRQGLPQLSRKQPCRRAAYDAANEETAEAFEQGVASYDFGGIGTIVDVGGGTGGFLSAILQRYPDARGVLFDLPAVIVGIRRGQIPDGVEARLTLARSDFMRDALRPAMPTCCRLYYAFSRTAALLNCCATQGPL